MNSFSTHPASSSMPDFGAANLDELLNTLKSASEKNQLQQVKDLTSKGETGLAVLMQFLLEQKADLQTSLDSSLNAGTSPLKPNLVAGLTYQNLTLANTPETVEFLQTHFPDGVVPLRSQTAIDYRPLQQLLAKQEFQAADQLTLQKLCELAGPPAVQRKWVYFTEVDQFPIPDLQTINALWLAHSEGLFGFSVQRELWLGVGKNWDKFWPKIGWKDGNNWTRYPQGFTWDLTAPRGHLPLSNQLRGVRVMASLMAHPAWG
jgi:hypothetical protein